ncbi:hypothetical protein KDL45_05525 [bacterium]|nr:hypothetical protein [bacterium]
MSIVALVCAAVALAVMPGACAKGDSVDVEEAPCPNEVIVKDFEGPVHIVMGIGFGGLAALDIALDRPELFTTAASLSGPVDLSLQLAQIKARLDDFDNWPERPSRAEYLQFLRDLFAAFGNPCSINPDSKFYAPTGGSAIDPFNEDGTISAITFEDKSGFDVDFLLALDENGNGVRDAGEPVLCQSGEPFDDTDGDGIRDEDEAFDDFGLDGVDGTGDTGEGNGAYDMNPRVANWLAHDPATRVANGELNTNSLFLGALYLEAGAEDFWDFQPQADALIGKIGEIYAEADAPPRPTKGYCTQLETGVYDGFIGDAPYPRRQVFFEEKSVSLSWPGQDDPDDNHLGDEATRAARFSHALSFVSARAANGYFGDLKDESAALLESDRFDAPSVADGARLNFKVYLPAGYYDTNARFKTYPILFVLLDQGQSLSDIPELIEAQGTLASRSLAQQVILVAVRGERRGDFGGYSFFADQAADEAGGDYRALILDDLLHYLESRYRVVIRDTIIDVDDEDDDE